MSQAYEYVYRTVVDYDKILVLDKGSISQYGHPLELIKADGIFKKMCEESGEFDELMRIASKHLK